MKVLIAHNRYQLRGGEDSVVASESALLRKHGVGVEVVEVNNDHITGTFEQLKAAASSFYSIQSANKITAAIAAFAPDVVHVHNWFPTLSPAVFGVCRRLGVPVVHTLHNYRLLCVKASLYRDGHPCESCIGTTLRIRGVAHGCYRESRCGSAAATGLTLLHWWIGTWATGVDRFIALSQFARNKLIQGGLPAEKVVVKPNTLDRDPGARLGSGNYVAFVGRLTEEKGIHTLLECWRRNGGLPSLLIIGTGPLEGEVKKAASQIKHVEWLGSKSSDEVLEVLGNAKALIVPSHWYEGMPRVIIEALAMGTPVIASRLGTLSEMIEEGRTGMLFEAASPDALGSTVRNFCSRSSLDMRALARKDFELKYSGDANAARLIEIYGEAQSSRYAEISGDLRPARAA